MSGEPQSSAHASDGPEHAPRPEATTRTVLLTGATGLVGRTCLPHLVERGFAVRALTRADPAAAGFAGACEGVAYLQWDGVEPPPEAVKGADVIVHLAGEPVFGGLPTPRRCERMQTSRIDSTRAIVSAIAALPPDERPERLVCASATGFYGRGSIHPKNEANAPGKGFLARLCTAWEDAAEDARELGVRVARMRFGIILAREGGALATMRRPIELGIGGRLGHGRQHVPWIHLDDVIGALDLAIDGRIEGAVNVVAPSRVTNEELTQGIAKRLGKRAWLPVPAFVLRSVFGDIAPELLGNKEIVPTALEGARYPYRYRDIEAALDALIP